MEVTLDTLSPNDSCVVVKVVGEGAIRRRLLDMGITPDAEIFVRKLAPFGDPMELTVRGYELSIRKEEAKSVLVHKK